MNSIQASELFICGFDGQSLPGDVSSLLQTHTLGGLILFRRNIVDLEQVVDLNAQIINSNLDHPPLICVDQEGGRVARLRGISTDIPPLKQLTSVLLNDPHLSFRLGAMMGRELVAMGFHLDFAPVCDIALEQKDEDIVGDRSFSSDAKIVATLTAQMIKGMQASGLAACAKHFPGHGATIKDSHFTLPYVTTKMNTLHERELVPFKSAIKAQVASIMTAHLILHELDQKFPATMSEVVIDQLLRKQLEFNNVVISDDLDMKAVADHYELREIIEQSLMASVDMFIIGNDWDKSQEAIRLTQELIDTNQHIFKKAVLAQERIKKLRTHYVGKALAPNQEYARKIVRCPPHLDLMEALL
ncbi:MAG: beta-N-acetylhexosaminidase [Myxococcales bacterium]|nr:beta-N-acetylhexosaminidase [Myxococcales bacterium]USN50639.1 MAG: beta-N-acetylhexosaminidase [Myxococcales bacterium]